MNKDKEQLIRFAEMLYKEAFDANAYYLILQQYPNVEGRNNPSTGDKSTSFFDLK